MKKKVISLVGVIIMMLNVICPVAFAEEIVVEDSFPMSDIIGSGKYASSSSLGFDVLENEKYLLIAEGTHPTAFSNVDIHINDKIHVYEKPNSDHLDYKFLTTIKQDSSNASYDLPARDIYLYGDTLFVYWGNGIRSKNTAGYYSSCGKVNPLKYYDLSVLENGETPVGVTIAQGDNRTTTHAPFVRGGIAYVDDENGKIYHSSIMNATYARREYYVRNVATPTTQQKSFSTDAQGMNAVQFIVKDGYLYEMLQQKAGNGDFKSVNAAVVDGEGNASNNTIAVYDLESGLSICDKSSCKSISKYKRGVYTTDTAGDYVMQDIDVFGDYVYIATTNGLEYVNVEASKEAETLVTLSLAGRILEGIDVKGISIFGTDLYLGTDSAMYVYDISDGVPTLKATYTQNDGFCDFEVNEEENAIYAIKNGKGGVVVIDKSMLGVSLNVENFTFDNENNGFSAEVSSDSSATVKSMLLLYKGNKLVDMSALEWSVSAEKITVADSIETTVEDTHMKVMFVAADDETKVIPMMTEEGLEYEKEYGETEEVNGIYDSSVNVTGFDEYGVSIISGSVKDRNEKPILVAIKNSITDRLSYLDVLNVDEDGNYATSFKPSDSGEYTVTLSRISSVGKTEITGMTLPALNVSVPGAVEIPGVNALLVINAEYAHNVETLDVELSFDGDVFDATEDIELSEEFELKNAEVSEGSLILSLARKKAIKTNSFEFCAIPVAIAQTADYGDYNIGLTVTAKDEFGNTLEAETVDGNVEIVESTPKYDAIDSAKESLSKLIEAKNIDVENYLEEKDKIEDARAKVETAYSYLVRDSQLGRDLVSNLVASEEKLLEIKPYYDAVDVLNGTEAETIGSTLKANKLYFALTEDALAIYDEIDESETLSTDAIDTAMADETFIKPSDVKKLFAESIALEAFKETTWQSVAGLLEILSDGKALDISAYEELTYEQKTQVHQAMDLTAYESIAKIKETLDDAVEDAKLSNPGGSDGSVDTSSRPSKPSIYVPPVVVEKPDAVVPDVPTIPGVQGKPDDAVFDDIGNYDWAKEAITDLYNKCIINGKEAGKFAPADSVKREEFAKMVVLAFDIMVVPIEYDFSDVDNGAWYEDYVYALASTGIINGRDDGSFGVGDYITRQEIAVILERIANYKKAELKATETEFKDNGDISSWAESAMKKMYGSGILSGFEDNTVRPNENASRAQVAKIVYTALDLLN